MPVIPLIIGLTSVFTILLVFSLLFGLFRKNRRRQNSLSISGTSSSLGQPCHVPSWINLNQQSKFTITPQHEKVHYSILAKNAESFTEKFDPRVETLLENFEVACAKFGDLPCLGVKHQAGNCYQYTTFKEVMTRSKNFGSGLVKLGLKPGEWISLTFLYHLLLFLFLKHIFLLKHYMWETEKLENLFSVNCSADILPNKVKNFQRKTVYFCCIT